MSIENYPFVKELLKDKAGQVYGVTLDLPDYQKLVELLEDEGLYRAMTEISHEVSISRSEALQALEVDED
jgi:hypothetical protein